MNISAVSGAVSYGVGSVFGGTASGGLSASSVFNEAGRAVAHGLVGMGFSVVQGGDAWSGFLAGFAGSVAGSAVPMSGMGFTKTLVGGGLFSMGVGAGTSYITGGDPWIGAALGGLSFYANHMLHGDGGGDGDGDGDGKDKKTGSNKKASEYGASDVTREVIGAGLVEVGQPNVPKPGGIGGGGKSGAWTSRASKFLRNADKVIQGRLGTSATLGRRVLGTKGIGALLGRLTPGVGWGLLTYDIYDNLWILNAMQQGMANYHQSHPIQNPDNLIFHLCFVKGTLVHTTKGYKTIETLSIADSVYSYNIENNTIEVGAIKNTFRRFSPQVYELELDTEIIRATSEHPFYVLDKGWTKVRDLRLDDILKTATGNIGILKIIISTYEKEVYNIEVEGNHNYFVGKNRILVHNKY